MPVPVWILFILRFATLGANTLKLKQFLSRFAYALSCLMSHDCDNDYHQQTYTHTLDTYTECEYVLNAHPINSSESTKKIHQKSKKKYSKHIFTARHLIVHIANEETNNNNILEIFPLGRNFFRFLLSFFILFRSFLRFLYICSHGLCVLFFFFFFAWCCLVLCLDAIIL